MMMATFIVLAHLVGLYVIAEGLASLFVRLWNRWHQ